jgi:putative flippase GtrA
VRFAGVGGFCGAIQLALFVAGEWLGFNALTANIIAYLLSAQVNFALSERFIWGDRRLHRCGGALARRWLSFHSSIAGKFLLSQAVFLAARTALPDVAASAAGIGISALVNFAIQDRVTFRGARG